MEQNQHAFKIIASLAKSNKVKFFSITTTMYEYIIEKLNENMFVVSKETGYDLVKTTVEGVPRLLDTFKKPLITEIVILKHKRSRNGKKVYSLAFHENKTNVLDDIRMQPKQIYLDELHNECPICMEPLTSGNTCKPLNDNCDHYFHCDCLRKVRPNKHGQKFCPICRAEMYDIQGPYRLVNNKFGAKKLGHRLKTLLADIRILKTFR
jgi:hypothetical protein